MIVPKFESSGHIASCFDEGLLKFSLIQTFRWNARVSVLVVISFVSKSDLISLGGRNAQFLSLEHLTKWAIRF